MAIFNTPNWRMCGRCNYKLQVGGLKGVVGRADESGNFHDNNSRTESHDNDDVDGNEMKR